MSSRRVALSNMRPQFTRRRLPWPIGFAKAYLCLSSPSYSTYNHSALMRSHSTTTSTVSSCNAWLVLPMVSCWTLLPYRLHAINASSPPCPMVNSCELDILFSQLKLMMCSAYVHPHTRQISRPCVTDCQCKTLTHWWWLNSKVAAIRNWHPLSKQLILFAVGLSPPSLISKASIWIRRCIENVVTFICHVLFLKNILIL